MITECSTIFGKHERHAFAVSGGRLVGCRVPIQVGHILRMGRMTGVTNFGQMKFGHRVLPSLANTIHQFLRWGGRAGSGGKWSGSGP